MIPIIFLMQKQQSVCDYTTRWSYVTSLMMMMIENLLGLKRCLHVYEGSRMVKPKGRVMTSEKKERQHGPVGNVRTPMLFASFPCAELIIAPTLCSSLPCSCTPMRTGVVTLPRQSKRARAEGVNHCKREDCTVQRSPKMTLSGVVLEN